MLSSLNSLGYAVEWRVIDASEYGMPQRRKRIFIMCYKKNSSYYNILKDNSNENVLNNIGIFAKAFHIQTIEKKHIITKNISNNLVDITENFYKETPKNNAFLEAGYMIEGIYYTCKISAKYNGDSKKIERSS